METSIDKEDKKKGPLLGVRHLQVALLFGATAILFINRIHVAVTLVAMTNAKKSNPDFPEYDWNEKQKSYVLSSFYWGYVLTQFPGGYCVRRYGVKINLLIYTFTSGVFSIMMPLCVPWGGWQVICLLRFIQGLFQGGVYPAMQQHLAKWSPPMERSRLSGFAHTGFDCGIVLAMGLSGIVAASSLGWPGMFYIAGALCLVWCVLWLLFGANDVTQTKYITADERVYIEESLKSSVHFEKKRLPVPWRAIFTSAPFYALIIVRSASELGFFTIQAEWPSYINAVLKMNIRDNALFSALPAAASWIFVYIFMFIADMLMKHTKMSLTSLRKSFNSFGMWVPALGIIAVGYLNEQHKLLAVILMTVLVAIHSSIMMGCILVTIDMAPNHTSILVSIINMCSNLTLMLGPLYVGIVVNNEEDRSQWRTIFTTFAVIFCLGDLCFLIWGTAKEQPWNAADFFICKDEIQQSKRCDIQKNEVDLSDSNVMEHEQSNLKSETDQNFGMTNIAFEKNE